MGINKNQLYRQKLIERLLAVVQERDMPGDRTETIIPYLVLSKALKPTPITPVILAPSFCLILQGAKSYDIGEENASAGPGEYLASVIDLPATAQISEASKKKPYIGLRVEFTTKEVASVMLEAKINVKPRGKNLTSAAFVGKADNSLIELIIKLVALLDSPDEAVFLSGLIKREMIYRLLTSDYGHLFYQPVLFEQEVGGISKVIEWIKLNYSTAFSVEQLAKSNNMSVSRLHHKFKAVTSMGPLQYQKQIRLQEARRLLVSGSMDATSVALEVGYESPSQFNREYRRLFGLPPLKDARAWRKI